MSNKTDEKLDETLETTQDKIRKVSKILTIVTTAVLLVKRILAFITSAKST